MKVYNLENVGEIIHTNLNPVNEAGKVWMYIEIHVLEDEKKKFVQKMYGRMQELTLRFALETSDTITYLNDLTIENVTRPNTMTLRRIEWIAKFLRTFQVLELEYGLLEQNAGEGNVGYEDCEILVEQIVKNIMV